MRLIELAVVFIISLTIEPLAVGAQQPSMPRVGVLSPGKPPPDDAFRQQEHFEAGLRELGWTLGSNVVIDYRYADGNLDRLPALAAELVRIPVNVIVARGLTIRAAREATATVPIVMAADPDPVRSGFVVSLARPGGNITGLSTLAPDLEAKQLELLRVVLPKLTRVGVLANANSPSTDETARLEATTRALHLALTESRINRSEELATAFAAMKQAGMGAVLFRYDLWFIDPKQVATLVRQHRLPTMHNLRQFVEAGALVSYGVDFAYLHRRVATYVDRLIKGAKAADLPVEQPTKFEFVINLKTAKALGLTIPQSLLLRADQVIDP
jgi:putative tryptophan/tyrosine transport system substrate-binding protein